MNNTIELYVVGAKAYSFNDRETGRLVEGVNIFYLNEDKTDNQSVGQVPAKVTLPFHFFDKVSTFKFPSLCKATLEQQLTAKGVKTKVVDLNFVKELK